MHTALLNYNIAAQTLVPPWPPLSWDDVIEYAFLANSDLLSNIQSDVHLKVWAKPASHLLMDQYFKMLQAEEEIFQLNIKIPHLTMLWENIPIAPQVYLIQWFACKYVIQAQPLPGFSSNINPRTSALHTQLLHTDVQQVQPHDLLTWEAVQDHTVHTEEVGEEEDVLAGAEVVDTFCVAVEGPRF